MKSIVLRNEFDTLVNSVFDDFWNEAHNLLMPTKTTVKTKYAYPRMNLVTYDTEYVVEAAVPGLTKDDVKVEFVNDQLIISGETKNDKTVKDDAYTLRELHKSSFSRAITLAHENIIPEEITASVHNGILKIKIPKKTLDRSPPKCIIDVE